MEVTYKLSNQLKLTVNEGANSFKVEDSGGCPIELNLAEMENIHDIYHKEIQERD